MMNKEADELEILKNELKQLLKEVGWSQQDLAREITVDKANSGYYHEEDRGNKNEYEKLKKALSRPTTKKSVIKYYIDFVVSHSKTKSKNLVKLPEIDERLFSEEGKNILKNIKEISQYFFKT